MIQGFGTVHSTTCSSGVDVKVSKVTTREGVCEFPKYPLVSILSSYLIICFTLCVLKVLPQPTRAMKASDEASSLMLPL